MKLSYVLKEIHIPIGLTSYIDGLLAGNFSSINNTPANLETSIEAAEKKFLALKEARKNTRSDSSYWGYNSQVAYWSCVFDLLRAAKITGIDNLPSVKIPDMKNMVVMDSAYALEKFGEEVFKLART